MASAAFSGAVICHHEYSDADGALSPVSKAWASNPTRARALADVFMTMGGVAQVASAASRRTGWPTHNLWGEDLAVP